jgi:hypothetical protein
MKNIVHLCQPSDIHHYLEGLWRTDAFRESHRHGGFINDLVERFAWLPRFFAEETNDYLERAHFSTWWNVIMLRDDYTNPVIHDLYYLHEIAHAATIPYIAGIGQAAFNEKMQRNELEASVLSEIQIYFEMPGLRENSFSNEIYADRFLRDPAMMLLWTRNREIAIETFRAKRKDVMVSKSVEDMDLTEQWIRRFAEQNAIFFLTWSRRYKEVEAQMAKLQTMDRRLACDNHLEWLQREMDRDPIDAIPFRQEAELFTPFYWSSKAHYAADMSDDG